MREWMGYQIIAGLRNGLEFQQFIIAAQALLPVDDIPSKASAVLFFQLLGGALMVSAGQNMFTDRLAGGLSTISGVDLKLVIPTGATELKTLVKSLQSLNAALEVYNSAFINAFQVSLVMACLSAVGAFGMEWESVKKPYTSEQDV